MSNVVRPPTLRYYRRILDQCEPYVIGRPAVRQALNPRPLGMRIEKDHVFDAQDMASATFVNLVKTLDEMSYAPLTMKMPDWVFYDCAVMPGVIFGVAQRAGTLPRWVRSSLQVPVGYTGLVPMSLMIAIPHPDRRDWLVWSLCSINEVAPGAAPEGLWRLTLAAAVSLVGMRAMTGTVRWRSPRLGLYSGLGPLELVTAWTPAHDIESTVTFRVETPESSVRRLLRGDLVGAEGIDRYIDPDSHEDLLGLQRQIEAGLHVAVVGPAEIRGSSTRVPLQVRGGDERFTEDTDFGYTRRFQG